MSKGPDGNGRSSFFATPKGPLKATIWNCPEIDPLSVEGKEIEITGKIQVVDFNQKRQLNITNMKWKEGGQFEDPSPGSHIARCYQVIDCGTTTKRWDGEERVSRDVRITFELPLELMEGKYKAEAKGKPFAVSTTKKQSLHKSSGLRAMLESWRGRKFSPEELQKYDPKRLLGVPCRLTLIQNENNRVVIDSIAPLGKNETCPAAVNPPVYFSLEKDEFTAAAFSKLSEKTQAAIKLTPEYAALFKDEQHDEVNPAPADESVPF